MNGVGRLPTWRERLATPAQRVERLLDGHSALLAAVLLAMVWGFWSPPLYDLDEGAFTEATREMIASGNYVSIYLNGEPRHDKPVMIYWLQAASVHLFGLNEFALRLPSVLAAIAWLGALYRFTRRHVDFASAQVAGLLFSLSLFIGLLAKAAVADALLNLFIALAMFDIFSHSRSPSRILLMRVFVWLGLGFLTKGPVAVFFPLVVSGLFYLGEGRLREWLRLALDWRGLLLFVAIVLPWHVAVYLDSGWAFFEGFYLHHNLDRYGDPMEGHGGGPWYYLVMAPLLVMPFAGWLLSSLQRLRSDWRDPLERFAWIWFFCVLAVFSLSGTKLPHYLLYGMSGLFVVMAKHRAALSLTWAHLLPPALLLAVLAASPQLFALLAGSTDRVYERSLFEAGAVALGGWPQWLTLAALLALGMVAVLPTALWRRMLLAGYLQALVVAVAVVPSVLGVLQDGPRAAGLFAREHDRRVVFHRSFQPSVSVYREQIIRHEPPRPGDWVYVRIDHLDAFLAQPSRYPRRVVFRHPPATLVEIGAQEQVP